MASAVMEKVMPVVDEDLYDFIVTAQKDSNFFKWEMNCANLTFLCYTFFNSSISEYGVAR